VKFDDTDWQVLQDPRLNSTAKLVILLSRKDMSPRNIGKILNASTGTVSNARSHARSLGISLYSEETSQIREEISQIREPSQISEETSLYYEVSPGDSESHKYVKKPHKYVKSPNAHANIASSSDEEDSTGPLPPPPLEVESSGSGSQKIVIKFKNVPASTTKEQIKAAGFEFEGKDSYRWLAPDTPQAWAAARRFAEYLEEGPCPVDGEEPPPSKPAPIIHEAPRPLPQTPEALQPILDHLERTIRPQTFRAFFAPGVFSLTQNEGGLIAWCHSSPTLEHIRDHLFDPLSEAIATAHEPLPIEWKTPHA